MMAAARAGELGGRVLLLEKNRSLGRKLLLTGGGRCNVTNLQPDLHSLVGRYGRQGRRLYSVFAGFGPQDMLGFLRDSNVPTKVEAEGRAFPADDLADSVLNALVDYMKRSGVQVMTSIPVQGLQPPAKGSGLVVQCSGERQFYAPWVVLATGGFARPETGSTGDAIPWLEQLGHRIHHPEPILVPVTTRESWTADLMGISFPDAGLTVRGPDGRGLHTARGKLLFTHFGLSGPLILNASAEIKELAAQVREAAPLPKSLKAGGREAVESPQNGKTLYLELDLLPGEDWSQTDATLRQGCEQGGKRLVATVMAELLPPKVANRVCLQAGLPKERRCSELSREERRRLAQGCHGLRLTYRGHLGADKAIVSRGGVDLEQVDFKTMESSVVPGLLLAGDILDFDRPSGGFSLQICWSTGWRAGERAAGMA